MTSEVFATGQCLCGAVRFIVRGAPRRMAHCHCKDCQRSSGAGHMSNAVFNAEDVEMVGETATYSVKADSGNTMTRHFCPTCGARMYAVNTGRPDKMILTAGTFDDSSWFAAEVVLYTKSRPAWDATGDSVPAFEAMPPAPAAKNPR
jgi:hypothetical protein